MTALARASMPTESTFQGSKVDGKAMLAPVAAAPTILAWSDKAASSSVHVSPKTSYPAGQRTPSGSPRAPSPHLQAVKPQGDPPVSPRRPRRPDSIIVEDGEINAAPSYGRFPGFSQIADLGVQLEDIITTYAADPSPELAEETTEAPTTPSDPKAADTPLPADPNAAIGAALAKLGLDGPKIKASTPIVPGSERSRTLLSLRQRTLHLSSLPDYGRRIDLLQKLEVAMGAFLSIEDVEAILCMEALPAADQIGPKRAQHSDSRRLIGRVRSSWRPKPRAPEPSRPVHPTVVGAPLDSLPADAFVAATIAGRPHDLPILCFAAVEEIYRRGQGPAVKNFMEAAGSPTRCDQLVTIYEAPPDYGERHDLSLESIHDVVALLKQYLQALPIPLLNDKLWRLFTTACLNSTRPLEKRIESAQLILQLLPTKHFNLLLYLAAGFSQLPLFPKNAVSIDKVASIFGDALFGLRTPTQQRHSIKRFGMTITAPSELLSDGRNQAGSATAALRWLLAHWPDIAEGLLAEDSSSRRSARPLSTETLNISTAPVSPCVDVEVTGEERAQESDVVVSAAEVTAPEAEDYESEPEPALSLSSSATASPRSPSVSTPPDPPSPLLSPEDEQEAHAALEKQLDDAIALLTVRRPSAASADNASIYAFPSPPKSPTDLVHPSAVGPSTPQAVQPDVLPDPDPEPPQSPRIPIGLAAHRRSQSDNVSQKFKSAPPPPPLSRSHSITRARLAQPPSVLTPPIPEDDIPPPLPHKRHHSGPPVLHRMPSTASSSDRHSIAAPSSSSRPGTKNFLLPAHARRYDEIVHLRQRLNALEKERQAERADIVDLRSELAIYKARMHIVRHSADAEQARIAQAEQRAVDAESRADEAERTTKSLRDRLDKLETARRREAAEAKQTAADLEKQLRALRDLIFGQQHS